LFLGSSCIYPKFAPQPIAEDSLLTGPLEPTNEWYAVAKISGIKMCQVSGSSKNAQVDVNLAAPTSIADTSFGLFHEKCQLEIALHYSMDVIALIICLTV
jgi:GDP-L-fucose synthase